MDFVETEKATYLLINRNPELAAKKIADIKFRLVLEQRYNGTVNAAMNAATRRGGVGPWEKELVEKAAEQAVKDWILQSDCGLELYKSKPGKKDELERVKIR